VEKNKKKEDKKQRAFSYVISESVKISSSVKAELFITFYKKNIWLLIVDLLLIVFPVIGFFVKKPSWNFIISIISIVVGVCALFFLPYWKIKVISQKDLGNLK